MICLFQPGDGGCAPLSQPRNLVDDVLTSSYQTTGTGNIVCQTHHNISGAKHIVDDVLNK